MEIKLSEQIKTMQLANKEIGIEYGEIDDNLEIMGGWAVFAIPTWDWYGCRFRPVAPEGFEHTGELRLPAQEYVICWETGKAVFHGPVGISWILRKVEVDDVLEEQLGNLWGAGDRPAFTEDDVLDSIALLALRIKALEESMGGVRS